MVDINSTLHPVISQLDAVINTVKVLVGGVFGIYLILLYMRWREYLFTRRLLSQISRDIRALADKQGVSLDPMIESNITKLTRHVAARFKRTPTVPEKGKTAVRQKKSKRR